MSGQADSSARGRESRRRSPRRSRSPARHKSSRRSRSPVTKSSSRRELSPVREKHSSHARSPKRAEPSPPRPRSPSPRTKRLRRAQAERETEKVIDKELEKNGGRERERVRRVHRERESEKEVDKEIEKNGGREREKVRRNHGERESEKEIDKEIEKNGGREREKERRNHGERESGREIDKEIEKNGGREREKARRIHGERDSEKEIDKEFEKNGGREREKARNREKGSDTQAPRERGDRGSSRDDIGKESSRSRRKHSSSPTDHRRPRHSASPAKHGRHERSQSPSDHHHRSRHRSRSPPRTSKNGKHHEVKDPEDAAAYEDNDSLEKMKAAEEALDAKKKQQPSFELSGKLAAETNRVRGVTLLFSEPPEARKPNIRWRLYVFKGGEVLNEPLYIHRQTCYLFGRERRVADVPTDHPSCSKQHAVIQFRQVEKEQPDGMLKKEVRPYLMDLGSTNGTFINDDRLEPQRYYELFEKDTIKFGNSSREYVMLHENSMDDG